MHRVWKGLLKNLARDVPPWQRHSVLSLSASLHQSPPRSETQVSFESEESHKNASGQQTHSPAPVGWLTPLLICQTYCPPCCSHRHQAQNTSQCRKLLWALRWLGKEASSGWTRTQLHTVACRAGTATPAVPMRSSAPGDRPFFPLGLLYLVKLRLHN